MITAEIKPLPINAQRLHQFSRFFKQPLYLEGNVKFWGVWEPIEIPPSPNDEYLTVD